MAQQKVELRKVRDFSDNLNDTFHFIKQNYKPLLLYVFGIAGLFMLIAAILSGIYQGESLSNFEEIFKGKKSGKSFEVFSGLYMVFILFLWLTSVALQVVVVSYLKVYEEKDMETPTFEEVWNVFRKHFLPITFYQIPILILILIGSVLCLAPGIYLGVVLAVFSSIIIIEDESFSGAFNRCFTLIKENFWSSLGVYFVIFMISYFGSGIVALVVGIITGVISYLTTEDVKSTIAIVTSILNVLSFVFYILVFVSITINYYNLTERYDGVGILRRLDGLGVDKPVVNPHSNLEEEY